MAPMENSAKCERQLTRRTPALVHSAKFTTFLCGITFGCLQFILSVFYGEGALAIFGGIIAAAGSTMISTISEVTETPTPEGVTRLLTNRTSTRFGI
jgi:hypothetical protein